MKKTISLLLAILFPIIFVSQAIACTSFAVYSNNKLYGHNFDYLDVKMYYTLSKYNDQKVFHMDFEAFGQMAPTVGMNEKGLFTSVQMLYPEQPLVEKLSGNQVDMHDFAINALFENNSVNEIENFIKDKKVVNHYLTCHDLFADKAGNAMVVEEAAGKNNSITKFADKYIVMTNFPNELLKTQDYKEISGAGNDRYAKAYEYILQHENNFDLEKAFEILKNTAQGEGQYLTQSSMVFDPNRNEIYIAVKRDFERIWKVSLDKETIESYKGFFQPVSLKLGEKGITVEDLQSYASADSQIKKDISSSSKNDATNNNNTEKNYVIENNHIVIYIIVFASLVFVGALTILLWRRRKKD